MLFLNQNKLVYFPLSTFCIHIYLHHHTLNQKLLKIIKNY